LEFKGREGKLNDDESSLKLFKLPLEDDFWIEENPFP
jgi:hypothetical protein